MSDILYTIGYEAATLPDVIEKLQKAGVKLVVDVRAVAASRRAGFSKTILRNSLEAEGILAGGDELVQWPLLGFQPERSSFSQ